MLRFFKSLFGKTTEPKTEAPYKVDAPAVIDTYQPVETPVPAFDVAPQPIKCGCGRSANGYCVGLHKLTAEEWASHNDNPNKVKAPEPEKKPTAKKSPAKKTRAKPAAITAAPKKPKSKKEAK